RLSFCFRRLEYSIPSVNGNLLNECGKQVSNMTIDASIIHGNHEVNNDVNDLVNVTNTFDNIPEDLKEINRWVAYKLIWDEKKGKYGKPPYSLDGKKKQGFNIYYSYEEVIKAVQNGSVDGI